MMKCDCCEAKAKYEVNEANVCGRHLAVMVSLHAPMKDGEVTVRRIAQ